MAFIAAKMAGRPFEPPKNQPLVENCVAGAFVTVDTVRRHNCMAAAMSRAMYTASLGVLLSGDRTQYSNLWHSS